MLGQQFYHETMRNVIVAFGTLFNNIHLVRKNNSGSIIQTMKVPLAYGAKQKWLTRLDADADLSTKVAITLPRLGFEIQNLAYDPARKLNRVQKFKKVKDSSANSGKLDTQFMPVPYNLGIELYAMAKQSDDALQIVEQILPFFQPDYTLTINDMTDMGIKRDVPIVLESVSYEDSYRGDYGDRRAIIYTLSFTSKFYLYGLLLHLVKLSRVFKLTSTQMYKQRHQRENKDILLHLIQQLLMQMMILDLTKLFHSFKMQKHLTHQLVEDKS